MRYNFLVFSNPTSSHEAEYNEWYTRIHLPDLRRIPGIVGARRMRLSKTQLNSTDSAPAQYLAIYEIESDTPEMVFTEIRSRTGSVDMEMSNAIDLASVVTSNFEVI